MPRTVDVTFTEHEITLLMDVIDQTDEPNIDTKTKLKANLDDIFGKLSDAAEKFA